MIGYLLSIHILIIFVTIFYYNVIYYKSGFFLRRPTIDKLIFWRDYIFLTQISIIYYLVDEKYKNHYILGQLTDQSYFVYASIASAIFIIIFLTSHKFFLKIFKGILRSISIPFSPYIFLRFVQAFILILSVVLFYLGQKFQASIWGLTQLHPSELALQRSILAQSGGVYEIIKIVVRTWAPFSSYALMFLYLKGYGVRKGDFLILLWSILIGILCALWFFEKSVLFFYLFGFLGVWIYSGKKVKSWVWLAGIGGAFFIVIIMYIITYGNKITGPQYIKDILVHRITGQACGVAMAMQYFSQNEPLGIAGISDKLAALSGENFASPYSVLIDHYVPSTIETSGAMSSFAAGEAFGLFGPIGIVAGGIVVALFYAILVATHVNPALSVVGAMVFAQHFGHFYVATSAYLYFFPVGVLYGIFPFLLFLFFSVVSSLSPPPLPVRDAT